MPSKLVHLSSGATLAQDVRWARTTWDRVRGLIGRELSPGTALIIEPAKQIHTFGLRHSIDVVFCDRDWVVAYVKYEMSPLRVSRWIRRARYVIELPGRTLPPELAVGDRLGLVA